MELKSYHLSVLTTARPDARTASDDLLLERSIATEGIMFPIVVRPLAERLFKVIDGERRVVFARRLLERGKLKSEFLQIPCLAVTIATPHEEAMWRLLCNLHTGLAPEAAAGLATSAGLRDFKPVSLKGEEATAEALTRMSDLIQGLAERRHQVRSSRRTLDAFDTARSYIAGQMSFQAAMDTLRFSSTDD